jgi:hypothetical protein
MARHRKSPVPRHKAQGRDASPASSEASEQRFGTAIRRVVATPTFAAGLGVVVAAMLAYPMQTVFSYVAPGASGSGGLVCTQNGCTHHSGQGKPYPFGVGDGTINPSTPAEPGGGSAGEHAGGGSAIAQPRLTYSVTGRWQGGFWGRITVTFPGAVPSGWRLRIGYPSRHILRVRPSSHLVPGGHAALVRSSDYSGSWGQSGHNFTIVVSVQGRPARPGGCRFNGRHCHFG